MLNHAFYGKTVENVRNRKENFLGDKERPKLQGKTNFDSVKTYDNFHVYYFKNKEVMFDKPIYLGFTLLE